VGKPGVAGVYTNQRLNLSKPWEGPRKICQGFKPDSGNLTVRHYRGASGNVRHGGNVNPFRNRKSGTETPHLQRGAPDFYPSGPDSPAEGGGQPGDPSVRWSVAACPDRTSGWYPPGADERHPARWCCKPALGESLPALLVRCVDAADLSEQSVREVRRRCHRPLQE